MKVSKTDSFIKKLKTKQKNTRVPGKWGMGGGILPDTLEVLSSQTAMHGACGESVSGGGEPLDTKRAQQTGEDRVNLLPEEN